MRTIALGVLVMAAAADQVRRGAAPVPQSVVIVRIFGCQRGAM